MNPKAEFERPNVRVNAALTLNLCMLIEVVAGLDCTNRYCSVKETLSSNIIPVGVKVAVVVALSNNR